MKFAFVTDVHRCRSRSTTAPKIIWTLHSHKTNWISYQRTLILRKRSISTFCSSKKKVLKTKNIVSLNLYLFSPLVEIRHTPSFQSFLYPVSPNIIIRASGEALLSVPAKQNRQQAGASASASTSQAHLRSEGEFGSHGNHITSMCCSLPRRPTAFLIYCGRRLSLTLKEMFSSSSWLSILIHTRTTQRQTGLYLKLSVTGTSGSLLLSSQQTLHATLKL